MKKINIFVLSLVLMFVTLGVANAQTLYGVAHLGFEGPTTLYMIDPGNGNATEIGPVGFRRCGGLAYDELNSTLFATCERSDGSETPVLVRINPATGAGTEVGVLDVCSNWNDLSFRNSDNDLFATGFGNTCGGGENTLVTVNTATGMGTIVGPMGNDGCCGNAMAFSPGDTLFFMDGDRGPPDTLYIVNQITGAANAIANVSYPPVLDDEPRPNSMVFNPKQGQLIASVVNGDGNDGTRENYLTVVNTLTGDVAILGTTVEGLDGLAFGPEGEPIPTISEWGMIATVAGLGLIGLFYAVRRSRLKA